ncbi:hypothetical protein BX666DRAFT_1889942 [Dichotomocladium elegans]|nr:hypothetical protein BX666DRAFT_1889942 [Dichotomocladium elegans]
MRCRVAYVCPMVKPRQSPLFSLLRQLLACRNSVRGKKLLFHALHWLHHSLQPQKFLNLNVESTARGGGKGRGERLMSRNERSISRYVT